MPVPALIEVTNRDFQCVARSKARSRKHLFFPNEESRPSKASTCSEIVFDLDGMPQVAEFRELETLISGQLMLTDAGAHHLATLLRLKSISCIQYSEEAAERLKAVLPHCEIDFRQQ
jgi:hypothetical protein